MADHQWLHDDLGHGVVRSSLLEMTAVLRCAASLADKEGMHHTANRLRHDADRVAELYAQHGQLVIVISG